ncbi:MAG: tetraacyldisaccharide 4'-kinase [Flavobacteriales bacterium]
MQIFRLLLYPFALLYGLVVSIRNKLFDAGVFKSYKHVVPTIVVGNLSVGGTGKSPHAEWLIKVFQEKYKLAVLSRGYGRKTRGFKEVYTDSKAIDVGDEPLQMKRKFPGIAVVVCEDRVEGLKHLQQTVNPNLILLDDAFQHRAVSSTCSILLTTYQKPFFKDHLLPSGNLRECKSGVVRASMIVVTKTPEHPDEKEMKSVGNLLKSYGLPYFFSSVFYGKLKPLFSDDSNLTIDLSNTNCLLVTGIADASLLVENLSKKFKTLKYLGFKDHHNYTLGDIQRIRNLFGNFAHPKIIVTTEKDAMRLYEFSELEELPIFYQEISISFRGKEQDIINAINQYVG